MKYPIMIRVSRLLSIALSACVITCLNSGLHAQNKLPIVRSNPVKALNSNCPDYFFELIGDLPGDCISSSPTDISADGQRAAVMSSADEPGVLNDGGACDPYLGWPHSNEAAGWTRPCKGIPFFTPPASGAGGLVGFGYLPGVNPSHNESVTRGISPDGKVIVGWSNFDQANHVKAVVITKAGMQALAKLDSGCMAYDISQTSNIASFLSDPVMSGRIVVGYSNTQNQYAQKLPGARAVYWDQWDHVIPLPLTPGSILPNDSIIISSEAVCISNDGKIIGGNLYYNKRAMPTFFMSFPCIWIYNGSTRNGPAYELVFLPEDLPGGDDYANIHHISGDGKVLTGIGSKVTGNPACWGYLTTACRWTLSSSDVNTAICSPAAALQDLEGFSASQADGLNFDGSVIVGTSFNVTGPCGLESFEDKAVIWKGSQTGQPPEDISALLAGKVPAGVTLMGAMRVSYDGNIICGYAFDQEYNELGWVAGLPGKAVPITDWALLLGFGLMIAASILLYTRKISG